MDYFSQQLINGVTLGSIYGLIAIGYTMVYGIVGMINFAHGEVFMIGAFIALIAILVAVRHFRHLGAACSVCSAHRLHDPDRCLGLEHRTYRLQAAALLFPACAADHGHRHVHHAADFVQLAQGARSKPLPPLIRGGFTLSESEGFAVSLSYLQILIIATTVVLMAVFSLVMSRTALGRAQRACEQGRKMAALCGVNVDRTISLTFVIGAALAAVAGLMFSSITA